MDRILVPGNWELQDPMIDIFGGPLQSHYNTDQRSEYVWKSVMYPYVSQYITTKVCTHGMMSSGWIIFIDQIAVKV